MIIATYKEKNYSYIAYIILIVQLINFFSYAFFYSNKNYLPAPFILDKNDTFMDFYNPLFWVINDGFYETYNSVYPAINYYILKIICFYIKILYYLIFLI
jgi:hypothetical protein